DAFGADSDEISPEQAVQTLRRDPLIDDAVDGEYPGSVPRAERIQDCARTERGLVVPYDRHVQARALALAEDDVEDLERGRIGVAVLRNCLETHHQVEIRVGVAHLTPHRPLRRRD